MQMIRPLAAAALAMLALATFPGGVSAQIPLTPVIGVNPSSLNFSSVPVGSDSTLALQLYNANPNPASVLEVTSLNVTGTGFDPFGGPTLPVAIPGGTTVPVSMRFAPQTPGVATGTLNIVASNAPPVTIPLNGEAITGEMPLPIMENITLGSEKGLDFQGMDGEFSLRGGDVLNFHWIDGVILLNGKRFRPGPTREEYLSWKGPWRKADLTRYQNVPFIRQRVALYGDTDVGWHLAFTEWDSITGSWANQVSRYYETHQDRDECRSFLLDHDPRGEIIESVEINELGVRVQWKGVRYPVTILLELPPPPTPEIGPRSVTHEEAIEVLDRLTRLLSGEGRNRVVVRFGSLANVPEDRIHLLDEGRYK